MTTTALSPDHSQKAKMISTRMRAFIDAIQGRSELKVGPASIVSLLDDGASLLELMRKDRARGKRTSADTKFLAKNPGKFFIRQGGILVRKPFASHFEATQWAQSNYKNSSSWDVIGQPEP